MAQDSKPTNRKTKPDKVKKKNSARELSFAYVYDCLHEFTTEDRFLGFTLSSDYVEEHKSRSEELSKLQYYFSTEVLQAILVWSVHQQSEPVIKWTNQEEMEAYLKSHGAT